MTKGHECEDFVNADGSVYRSHFIVNEEDFSREIMWISDHLTLDSRHFFRECCRDANGLWYIWVYLLGTQKEADNYIYTIKITSEDKVDFMCENKIYYVYIVRKKMSFYEIIGRRNCLQRQSIILGCSQRKIINNRCWFDFSGCHCQVLKKIYFLPIKFKSQNKFFIE